MVIAMQSILVIMLNPVAGMAGIAHQKGIRSASFSIYNPITDVRSGKSILGDGRCDTKFNTEFCGWDAGGYDAGFNANYPNCHVDYPNQIGNGGCDDGVYNKEVCDWDGGDFSPS